MGHQRGDRTMLFEVGEKKLASIGHVKPAIMLWWNYCAGAVFGRS
jgi:hypothetical protein